MIKINLKQVKEMEARLGDMKKIAVPFAVRNTLNQAAFQSQTVARRDIQRNMIIRNKFTKQSIRVETAKDLRRPEAVVGSVEKYMETQEFGGTKSKKAKNGVPLATSFSSGEGRGTKPRKKLSKPSNRLLNIQLGSKGKGRTRKQRNLFKVRQAAASGSKIVYLKTARAKGLYRVTGGKRNPEVEMIFNLSRTSVKIKRNPWLRPAVLKVGKRLPQIHFLSLQFQFKRLKPI